MTTFRYVKKDGSLGTFESNNSATALRSLPGDADPSSGVQSMPSGTGTPAPAQSPLPAQAPATVGGTPSLPNTTSQNGLLTFAESLDRAVNLARQKRNASSLDIMEPYRGTVMASDFNSILGNLNKASDSTSADLIKRATEGPSASNVLTVTNDAGVVSGIDKATGNVLWSTQSGIGNQQTPGGGTLAERTASSLAEYSSSFTPGHYLPNGIPTIDSDGFITPEAWKAAIAEAPSRGITRADFIKQFGHMILNLGGEISPLYGLTPVELRLLLGEGGSSGNPWG